MNIQAFKNRNGLIILVSLFLIVLIYSIDFFKLSYRIKGWEQFGTPPIEVHQIQYLIPDTPDVVGYKDPQSGEAVSCANTVVYARAETDQTYRCCDTGKQISCLAGNFSGDIPAASADCTNNLRELFGIPASLEGTKDYQLLGNCSGEGTAEITVVQVDGKGQVSWKFLDASMIAVLVSTLRCILAPVLLLLAIGMVILTLRGKKNEPIPRF